MKKFLKSEKEELLSLANYIDRYITTDPDRFLNSPDCKDILLRFNTLAQTVPVTVRLTREEASELERTWNHLKSQIVKRAKSKKQKPRVSPQDQLINALRRIKVDWDSYSSEEKKELIGRVEVLQRNPNVIKGMSPDQLVEYKRLMDAIRKRAIITEMSREEFSQFGTGSRRF